MQTETKGITLTTIPERQHTIIRVRHELKMRVLTVLRTEQLSRHMLRITLTGDDLQGFVSAAHDDHIKLFFPAPGSSAPILPVLGNGPNPISHAEGERPVARNYTPRRYDPVTKELDVDFMLHGDGPASSWAAQAKPGQTLGVGGPRGSLVVPPDFDWYLLIGDQAALPAIGRRLEELPADAYAIVLIETLDEDERIALPTRAIAGVTWVHRNGKEAHAELLLQALREVTLPEGEGYAWVATEHGQVQGLRRFLLDAGLPQKHVHVASYWKHGASEHHQTHDE